MQVVTKPESRDARETREHLARMRRWPMPTDNYAASINASSVYNPRNIVHTHLPIREPKP